MLHLAPLQNVTAIFYTAPNIPNRGLIEILNSVLWVNLVKVDLLENSSLTLLAVLCGLRALNSRLPLNFMYLNDLEFSISCLQKKKGMEVSSVFWG